MHDSSTGRGPDAARNRREVDRLRRRIETLERRHARMRRWVLAAASPLLLLAAPVLIPLAWLRRASGPDAAVPPQSGVRTASALSQPWRTSERTIIRDAHLVTSKNLPIPAVS
jgi:hypothetical protein